MKLIASHKNCEEPHPVAGPVPPHIILEHLEGLQITEDELLLAAERIKENRWRRKDYEVQQLIRDQYPYLKMKSYLARFIAHTAEHRCGLKELLQASFSDFKDPYPWPGDALKPWMSIRRLVTDLFFASTRPGKCEDFNPLLYPENLPFELKDLPGYESLVLYLSDPIDHSLESNLRGRGENFHCPKYSKSGYTEACIRLISELVRMKNPLLNLAIHMEALNMVSNPWDPLTGPPPLKDWYEDWQVNILLDFDQENFFPCEDYGLDFEAPLLEIIRERNPAIEVPITDSSPPYCKCVDCGAAFCYDVFGEDWKQRRMELQWQRHWDHWDY